MPRFRRTDRTDARRTSAALALAAACLLARPASAQFYEKVNLADASATVLRESLCEEGPLTGMFVASLSGLEDPRLAELFRAMVDSPVRSSRVYGILGDALLSKKGIDPTLMAKLDTPERRAVVIREANVTGILRESPVDALLAQGSFSPAATLTLVGESSRRGLKWDRALLDPILAGKDDVAAGVAALLRLAAGDDKPWQAFRTRLDALTPAERTKTVRALAEGVLIFEAKGAVPALLALRGTPGTSDEASFAIIGTALRLDPKAGVEAWQDHVASHRTQSALLRAGLQLLASSDRDIPAGAFDQVRNGSPVLEAMADAGRAMRAGTGTGDALVKLIDAGYSPASEWAVVRAVDLPPEEGRKVWQHLLDLLSSDDPDQRPTPMVVAGLARELMRTDPAALAGLVTLAGKRPELMLPVLTGLYESKRPEAAAIARAQRGKMSRACETMAAMTIARCGAPLTDDDLEVIGRAAAGGGDLTPAQQSQAAWYYLVGKLRSAPAAIARITAPAPAPGKAP
jgi:hypothetical protein